MSKTAIPIIVTVADPMVGEIESIAHQLADRGMKVTRILPLSGVIQGSWAADSFSNLHAVPGVEQVEEELSAELPPSGMSPQ